MKSTEHTFTSLIAIEGNQWHYHIPRFQREYVWGRTNWSKLIDDIYENEPGHYMGSIICVHDSQELSPSSELIYEVVDGQQRLTTLSLLLCAIYKKFREFSEIQLDLNSQEQFIIKRNSIKQRLLKKVSTSLNQDFSYGIFKSGSLSYCLRVQPSIQNNNLDDYLCILKELQIITEAKQHRFLGNRIIYRGYSYFLNRIPTTLEGLYDLLNRIYSLEFIHILESTHSKAFMLFETLNYRGVPLSAIDIVKNKMLATLEKQNVSIDESFNKWQKLLESLPEDEIQTRFLRQYYNAFKQEKEIKIDRITRATGSNIILIYENLIKKNAQFILDELIKKGGIYNQFIQPENYPNSELTSDLIDLARIGAAPSYTFLLYLLSLSPNKFEDNDVIKKTVKLLCKYYFRRNVTDFPGTNILDAINIDLIEGCQKCINDGNRLGSRFLTDAILTGKGQPSPLDEFKRALSDNLFFNNRGMARYALTKLDETSHSREYTPNLWYRNEKGLFVWTVEHIFPQGRTIPTDWVEMIANGDKNDAEKIQGEWVHCLGNLTLSGYNSRLSNLSFSKKQEKSDANIFGMPINIGYKNGLYLNKIPFVVEGKTESLATAAKWDLSHIAARNKAMVNMLIDLFKFDNE